MAIEVRQMVIKSTVLTDETTEKQPITPSVEDLQQLKAAILSECKQVILEALRERKER